MYLYSYIQRSATVALTISMLFFIACDGPDLPTYNGENDPYPLNEEPPTLDQILPEGGFPGDMVTITGSGFQPHEEQTMINIGEGTAEIQEISEDEIVARVPQNESGDQRVRAAVWGSDLWSNELSFEYLEDFAELEMDMLSPTGIAVDDLGNLFISSGDNQAIYRIDVEDSARTVYADVTVTGPMEFGPDGRLFAISQDGLVSIPEGGGSYEEVIRMSELEDFDWDTNGDIYLLQAGSISRYAGGRLEEDLASVSQGAKMRIFDGTIYVTELFRSRVVQFDITGGSLGELEVFANIGTPLSGLDVDGNGNVYAAAFIRDYIFKIPPDHDEEGVEIEEIPEEDQRDFKATSIDERVAEVYLHNTVMYLVQNLDTPGEIGRIWRIFIDEPAAPKEGRE